MTDQPLRTGGRYLVKHTTREVTAIVEELCDHVDVHTLERAEAPQELALNDIGRVRLRTSAPLVFDPYASNRRTGSFILIDERSDRQPRRDRGPNHPRLRGAGHRHGGRLLRARPRRPARPATPTRPTCSGPGRRAESYLTSRSCSTWSSARAPRRSIPATASSPRTRRSRRPARTRASCSSARRRARSRRWARRPARAS